MLTIKNLKYFIQLAKDLHFNKAAQHSFVSQSSLSAGIKSLEQHLGVQLFIRNNKKVKLTTIGQKIVKKAEKVLAMMNEIEHLSTQDFWKTTINIGVIPTISPYILPHFIKNIKTNYPDLSVNITETTSETLLKMLLDMRIDFAIFALPYDLPNEIETQILFKDKFKLIKHKEYNGNKLLLLEEGHCLRKHILDSTQISINNISNFNCSSINTLVAMLNLGLGMSFLPQMASSLELSQYPDIVIKNTDYYRNIGIIYHKNYAFIDNILTLTRYIKNNN